MTGRLVVVSVLISLFSAVFFPAICLAADDESVLLAIDDVSLPLKQNLCLYLSKPSVRKEPVLIPTQDNPNAPDASGTSFYGTVLFDQGRYRMWYYSLHFGTGPLDLKQGPICYAESDDGIRWSKPNLGQVEVKGSRENNAIKLPDEKTQGAFVIKEENDPDPQRRYKMVYNANNGETWVFRTATSADGIHWKPSTEFATKEFLEISSFYANHGLYVVNGQGLSHGEGGIEQGRQGFARISTDFDHWLTDEVATFALPEPAAAAERGVTKPYDQVHLGVGAKSMNNVFVGLYGIWHNQPGDTTRNIPNPWFGYGKTSCDLGLVVSNDGLHFREPVKGHVFLSRFDSPAQPVDGESFPTILCQSGNGILNVGNETRIYHSRWRNADYGKNYWVEIGLATLPKDRWGALGLFPDQKEGSLISAPITLPEGCVVSLNADSANGIFMEIVDPEFKPLEKFSGEKSGKPGSSEGFDIPVTWPAGKLDQLAGRTVRFRMHLNKQGDATPRLYAIYLKTNKGADKLADQEMK